MNELKLIVKNAATQEQMILGTLKPTKEILHEFWNQRGRRGLVDDLHAGYNPNITGSEPPRFIDQRRHHDPVRLKQVF